MKKPSWNNLTLGQYADFEYTRKQECKHSVDLLEKDCKLISLLTKTTMSQLEDMPMDEFNAYRKAMYDFVAVELKGRFVESFKLDNRKFVFDPSNNNIKACIEAGLQEVPIIIADNLTAEQEKEFLIKDNVSGGEWDWDMIANEWDEVQLIEWGLDIPNFDNEVESEEKEGQETDKCIVCGK